jgi:hypothetical protein
LAKYGNSMTSRACYNASPAESSPLRFVRGAGVLKMPRIASGGTAWSV